MLRMALTLLIGGLTIAIALLFRGNSSVTTKRTTETLRARCRGLSTQYRSPPPTLTSWPPTFVTLVTSALTGTDHSSPSQS